MAYVSDLINEFLESLEIENGRSRFTTRNYELCLSRITEFSYEINPDKELKPEDITQEWLRKYRLWLNRYEIANSKGKTLSVQTQAYHLIALRGFLKYLTKRGIKTLDPVLVELPRTHRPQVTFLHVDEIERIFAEIPLDTETGLRDRAIMELLFSSGLRVSELINLNRDNVNLKRKEFMVRGKGQKDRPVFISDSAAEAIEDYLAERHDSLPALFLNNSRNSVFSRFNSARASLSKFFISRNFAVIVPFLPNTDAYSSCNSFNVLVFLICSFSMIFTF